MMNNLISRQAVKEQMIKYGFHAPDMTVTEFVEDLPSVTAEPFINKPCVSEQACREDKVKVLGKIRERIELEKLGYTQSSGYYKAIIKCLQIIDKYIAESEDDVIKRKAGTPREDYMPLYNCENWIP